MWETPIEPRLLLSVLSLFLLPANVTQAARTVERRSTHTNNAMYRGVLSDAWFVHIVQNSTQTVANLLAVNGGLWRASPALALQRQATQTDQTTQ